MHWPNRKEVELLQPALHVELEKGRPTVSDLMTENVVSVYPEDKLMKAHERMFRRGFSALPVVDKNNHLVGILTDYDLVMTGSSLHLPTFQKLLSGLKFLDATRASLKKEIRALNNITVRDVMNKDPVVVSRDATIAELAVGFRDNRVVLIPVVDANGIIEGVVTRYDILKLFDKLVPLKEDEKAQT